MDELFDVAQKKEHVVAGQSILVLPSRGVLPADYNVGHVPNGGFITALMASAGILKQALQKAEHSECISIHCIFLSPTLSLQVCSCFNVYYLLLFLF